MRAGSAASSTRTVTAPTSSTSGGWVTGSSPPTSEPPGWPGRVPTHARLPRIGAVGLFDRKDDDSNLVATRADAEGALPEGWKLAEEDREGFLLVGPETQISLDVWAAAAEGPN